MLWTASTLLLPERPSESGPDHARAGARAEDADDGTGVPHQRRRRPVGLGHAASLRALPRERELRQPHRQRWPPRPRGARGPAAALPEPAHPSLTGEVSVGPESAGCSTGAVGPAVWLDDLAAADPARETRQRCAGGWPTQ